MKKDILNKMVEQFYHEPGVTQKSLGKAEVAFVKYYNQYALVIDKELDQNPEYKSFTNEAGYPMGLPVFVLFNSIKDFEKLKKATTIIDTSVFVNKVAQTKFSDSKIISKGTCEIDVRYDTFILKNFKLKQFPKSVLVVRVDSYNPGMTSKTTNEIPARTYFNLKEQDFGSFMKSYAITAHVMFMIIGLFMLMATGASIIKESKRRRDLETKFKSIIKDGKDWKVYIVDDDAPNAFAIIMPNIFVTVGLLKMLDEEETIAVMLHEAGHIKNLDVLKSAGTQYSLALFFLSIMIKLPSYGAVIAYIVYFVILGSETFQLIRSRLLGRPAEYRADSFAAKYGYGDQLISALKKLEEFIKKETAKRPCGTTCKTSRKMQEYLDDHPEFKDRVEAILKSKEAWELAAKKSFKQFKEFAIKLIKGN